VLRGGAARPPARHFAVVATLLLLAAAEASDLRLKQVAYLDRGLKWTTGRVVSFRSSPDSSPMLVFQAVFPYQNHGVHYYQYEPVNRFRLARVDTGNTGSGLAPGNMIPWAAADMNHDGCTELFVKNSEYFPDSFYLLAAVYSRPMQSPYPDSLVWRYRYDSAVAYNCEPFHIADLDQDSTMELVLYSEVTWRLYIFEHAGPDSFRLVWSDTLDGYGFAFGDFDEDGRQELVTASNEFDDWVKVVKCTGDNQYVLWDSVGIHLPNGQDVFAARNLDGTNRAVAFVSFMEYMSGGTYLYTCEPTQGTRGYQLFLVDSSTCLADWHDARSCCADVDGDGIEEVFWSCGTHILAYRKTGPHQFEQCWYWSNQDSTSCNITSYDINANGYNELIMSGSGRTFIYEVDAIQVLSPNGRQTLVPGETCQIRWLVLTPPRCDSVSLFLRSDTATINGFYRLYTIAHGLSPAESTYSWLVPDTSLDSARIVAIAYGPGWQFDESDSAFAMAVPCVSEAPGQIPPTWALSVDPNPAPIHGALSVCYEVPAQTHVSIGMYDSDGRLVRSVREGIVAPGRYETRLPSGSLPAGVYFCTLDGGDTRINRKAVLID